MRRAIYVVAIAGNMLICSLLFAPWALSRESISGLMGRWAATDNGWKGLVGAFASLLIDHLHFWEDDHCHGTYLLEQQARLILANSDERR